jgi:hypothetical protein
MQQQSYLHCSGDWKMSSVGTGPSNQSQGDIAMKTILSALVALSVIAGVAGTASALDAKTFFEQIDRDHN